MCLTYPHTANIGRYSAVFHDVDAWNASAAWYAAEVAEYERNGDGTPRVRRGHHTVGCKRRLLSTDVTGA